MVSRYPDGRLLCAKHETEPTLEAELIAEKSDTQLLSPSPVQNSVASTVPELTLVPKRLTPFVDITALVGKNTIKTIKALSPIEKTCVDLLLFCLICKFVPTFIVFTWSIWLNLGLML